MNQPANQQSNPPTSSFIQPTNQWISQSPNPKDLRKWIWKNQSLWCFYFFCLMRLMWKSSERSKQHLSWTQFADHQNCYVGFLHCPVNHEDAFQLSTKSDHGTKEGLNLNCLLLGGKLIKLIQFGILKCFSVEPYTGTLESSNLIEQHFFLRGLTTV